MRVCPAPGPTNFVGPALKSQLLASRPSPLYFLSSTSFFQAHCLFFNFLSVIITTVSRASLFYISSPTRWPESIFCIRVLRRLCLCLWVEVPPTVGQLQGIFVGVCCLGSRVFFF